MDKLKSIKDSVMNAAKKVFQKIIEKATEMANAFKDALLSVLEGIMSAVTSAINWIVKMLKSVYEQIPKFQSVTIGDIYVQCLTDPKACDRAKARLPSFEVCFTNKENPDGTCMTTKDLPTIQEMPGWLAQKLLNMLKKWLNKLIVKSTMSISIPGTGGFDTKPVSFNVNYPSGLDWKGINFMGVGVTVPSGIKWSEKKMGTLNIPTGFPTSDISLEYPSGIDFSGVKKQTAEEKAEEKKREDDLSSQ
jgi:hypothetical protein